MYSMPSVYGTIPNNNTASLQELIFFDVNLNGTLPSNLFRDDFLLLLLSKTNMKFFLMYYRYKCDNKLFEICKIFCIQGTIPETICNSTKMLRFLIMKAPYLTGTIPDCPKASIFESLERVYFTYAS